MASKKPPIWLLPALALGVPLAIAALLARPMITAMQPKPPPAPLQLPPEPVDRQPAVGLQETTDPQPVQSSSLKTASELTSSERLWSIGAVAESICMAKRGENKAKVYVALRIAVVNRGIDFGSVIDDDGITAGARSFAAGRCPT